MIEFPKEEVFAGGRFTYEVTHNVSVAGRTLGGCVYPKGHPEQAVEIDAGDFAITGDATFTATIRESITILYPAKLCRVELWVDDTRSPVAYGFLNVLDSGRFFAGGGEEPPDGGGGIAAYVISVNGVSGVVEVDYEDVGAAATVHTHAIADVTGLQTALDEAGGGSYDPAGTAAAAVAAHEAAGNPHPVYLTQAEGDALYFPIAGVPTSARQLLSADGYKLWQKYAGVWVISGGADLQVVDFGYRGGSGAIAVYSYFASDADYERYAVRWVGNVCVIGTEAAAPGVVRPVQTTGDPWGFGRVKFTAGALPADGDVAAGDVWLTFDATNGAAKVRFKGKTLDGTVVSADILLGP